MLAVTANESSVTANTVVKVIGADVIILNENPATTNISAQLIANIEVARDKAQITAEGANLLIAAIEKGNIKPSVSPSPN
jgi:hypothetical protein